MKCLNRTSWMRLEPLSSNCIVKFVDLRVCSVNVGTVWDRLRKIAEMMQCRSGNICFAQETRFWGKLISKDERIRIYSDFLIFPVIKLIEWNKNLSNIYIDLGRVFSGDLDIQNFKIFPSLPRRVVPNNVTKLRD